jgi:hypothetical protein
MTMFRIAKHAHDLYNGIMDGKELLKSNWPRIAQDYLSYFPKFNLDKKISANTVTRMNADLSWIARNCVNPPMFQEEMARYRKMMDKLATQVCKDNSLQWTKRDRLVVSFALFTLM